MILHDTISSTTNPRIRDAARLRDADVRRATGLTLVDGRRELARAVRAGVPIEQVFVDAAVAAALLQEDAADDLESPRLAELAAGGTRITALSRRAFERIAFGGRNEGVVGVARFRPDSLAAFAVAADRPVLLLEGVEKPGNLGAILRTADAAGLAGVVVCDGLTDAANPAVIRASLGTVFAVPLASASTADTIAWCRSHDRRVVAATPAGAMPWHRARLTGSIAMLLGSEARGISSAWRKAADENLVVLDSVRLPMAGVADSLNVSATAAVLAYESLRQQDAASGRA